MTGEQYKKLSLREFDQAAEAFDDHAPSVYTMCRKDYPDVLAEVRKEPFADLLDAGCGTGAMLSMFQRDCPDRHYICEDQFQMRKYGECRTFFVPSLNDEGGKTP